MLSRAKIQSFIEAGKFQNTIIVLIVTNAVILGLETSQSVMGNIGNTLTSIDSVILGVFVVEIALRIYVYRLKFFKSAWNLFDFAIVAISLIPASEAFSALRALRILRVLRLISMIPTMRKVIEGLVSAIPGIASVSSIMVLLFYIFAVIGTHLFGQAFPEWFGTLGRTMFSLFQIMTLESWSMGIVRPVMDEFPNSWIFFVTYILVTTFTMLNLFIAIIVNAMHSGADEEAKQSRIEMEKSIKDEIKASEEKLMKEIKKLK